MKYNSQTIKELKVMIDAEEYEMVRAWFSVWHTWDELIDKVLLWGQVCMPEYIRDPSPDFHRDLIKKFFSKRNEYTAAPRGFSKTTLIQLCISFSTVNKLDTFIVVVEKSFNEAAEVISGVRDILVNGEMIQKIYGKLLATDDDKAKDATGDTFINDVRLRAKGFNTPIRGLKSKEHRPSRIILDDVESDEHIDNPEQRLKYMDNYNKGIQPAVDVEGAVKVFGTILHFDSLLANLIKWHRGKIYCAYDKTDPANTLLWPERWTFEHLMKKKAEMTTERGSNAFTQEYLNDPVSEEDRVFKQQWLWRPDREIEWSKICKLSFNGYASIDVADSTNIGSDWTGVVVHLIDGNGNHYRVWCKRERRNIIGLVDLIFELWGKWRDYGLNEIGVEKKALHDQVMPMLQVEKQRRQMYPIVTELKPMHNEKTSRIKGNLQGRYETGKIWTVTENGISVGDTELLKHELYNFPSSKNDDLSDAEAYLIDMAQIPSSGTSGSAGEPNDDPFNDEPPDSAGDDPF